MVGRVFLLELEDNLLYNDLKDSGWSYLKENHQTFRKIAELWGEMLALGENVFRSFGVERMTILISTSHLENNSIVQLEAGKGHYLV
ncbi:hypothetical protein V6N13_096100 [Hibiscus sabdariffa]